AAASLTGDAWLAPMPPAGLDVRLAALALIPVGAYWEEVVHRGVVLPRLRPAGLSVALLVSSLAFAGLHFLAEPLSPERLLLLVGIGLVLGAAFLASGDLWFPIGVHCGLNGVAFVATTDPLSGGIWRLVVVLSPGSFLALAGSGLVLAGLLAVLLPRSLRRSALTHTPPGHN
ncbi:MAG: CPBP family intramembrane metalloprotease, partial [Candidatus Eisenbacteria bacterium]|nr:CPBP family intramembrane metalloprotease [Candidatus Latescibacterota bacterium]MBD3301424.1 CPBP family intramembrane metalloprotease [Candidatus Eisenbacteria bacterium]